MCVRVCVCRASPPHGHSGHQEPGDQQRASTPQLLKPAAVPPQQRAGPSGQED